MEKIVNVSARALQDLIAKMQHMASELDELDAALAAARAASATGMADLHVMDDLSSAVACDVIAEAADVANTSLWVVGSLVDTLSLTRFWPRSSSVEAELGALMMFAEVMAASYSPVSRGPAIIAATVRRLSGVLHTSLLRSNVYGEDLMADSDMATSIGRAVADAVAVCRCVLDGSQTRLIAVARYKQLVWSPNRTSAVKARERELMHDFIQSLHGVAR